MPPSTLDHIVAEMKNEDDVVVQESEVYHKGVKHICEKGIDKVPTKYILPTSDRPNPIEFGEDNHIVNLPIIDFAQLQTIERSHILQSIAKACQEYGFFQLINHGITSESLEKMMDVGKRFFELPLEERSKYMSKDMRSPVRCGTSFNQNKDKAFYWRDFLKFNCHPSSEALCFWPSSPVDFREVAWKYSKEIKKVYVEVMDAILESLGLVEMRWKKVMELEEGSQMIVVNYYPSCPEPGLTLGIPPHSDYGLLTLLLQDDQVEGLQIQHQAKWLTLRPLPNSLLVNVGDHLEIFSNGRYKSILHRAIVNPCKPRISIASFHSLSFNTAIQPCSDLIDEANPQRYKDTDFASFLDYISSCEPKSKNFLHSRKLT